MNALRRLSHLLFVGITVVSAAMSVRANDELPVTATVRRNLQWPVVATILRCPTAQSSDVVVHGIRFEVTEFERPCLEREDVFETRFWLQDGALHVNVERYRIVGASKLELRGDVAMIKAELAPVDVTEFEDGTLISVTGAIFTFYYVPTKRDGEFDLRVEQRQPPIGQPPWIGVVPRPLPKKAK